MLDSLIQGFLKQGLLGLVIVALGIFIIWLMKGHSKEKKEMREELKDIAERGIKAQTDNTSILSALKTMLETTREKK